MTCNILRQIIALSQIREKRITGELLRAGRLGILRSINIGERYALYNCCCDAYFVVAGIGNFYHDGRVHPRIAGNRHCCGASQGNKSLIPAIKFVQ